MKKKLLSFVSVLVLPVASMGLLMQVTTQDNPIQTKAPAAKNVKLKCIQNGSVNGRFDATDAGGGTLFYKIIRQPNNGTLGVNGDSFTYTPDNGYAGRDIIWYVATDRYGRSSNTGGIEVTVNGTIKQPVASEGRFVIDISDDGTEREFPLVHKFGNNIFVIYSEHPDSWLPSPEDAMMISRDNGLTWTKKVRNRNFYLTSMVEKDGVLYGIVYYTYLISPATLKMIYWTSADYGETWDRHDGMIYSSEGTNFTQKGGAYANNGNLMFHMGMLVMEDGSIQGVMQDVVNWQTVWVKSNDNCATWNVVSQVTPVGSAPDCCFTHKGSYNEPTIARVKDGSILCVMRISSFLPLYACRSYDNGLTWTKTTSLKGLTWEQSSGVDPCLKLMSNGVLALSYGRPGAAIAFSIDGSGYSWGHHQMIFTGSKGYTGIVETESGRLLYVADQSGAQKDTSDSMAELINARAVWGTFINVNISPGDYVDIAAGLQSRKIAGLTATGSSGISEATGSNALIDGNEATVYIPDITDGTDINSSVPAHSVVLDMGGVKNLNSVIVRHQFASIWKYKIEVSSNNTDWSTFSDKTNNNCALENSRDDDNINTRYVKYTITGNKLTGDYKISNMSKNIHNYISIREIELYGEGSEKPLLPQPLPRKKPKARH